MVWDPMLGPLIGIESLGVHQSLAMDTGDDIAIVGRDTVIPIEGIPLPLATDCRFEVNSGVVSSFQLSNSFCRYSFFCSSSLVRLSAAPILSCATDNWLSIFIRFFLSLITNCWRAGSLYAVSHRILSHMTTPLLKQIAPQIVPGSPIASHQLLAVA